jgi:pimeloyl-ACP methyl ester carboxylesterase
MVSSKRAATSAAPTPPLHDLDIAAPGVWGSMQELRLPLDAARWVAQWWALGRRQLHQPRPAEQKQTVMLLPGFGAGPRSMVLLAKVLRQQGHQVVDWGIGRNTGQALQMLGDLSPRLAALSAAQGQPVVLVGWSLGGYLARELARDAPQHVRKVITLGSPVVGGPSFTAVAPWYRARGYDLKLMAQQVAARFNTPLRVPVVAIYSKRDGVVSWQACIDHWSPQVQHQEVRETHLGLGFAPQVLALVAAQVRQG